MRQGRGRGQRTKLNSTIYTYSGVSECSECSVVSMMMMTTQTRRRQRILRGVGSSSSSSCSNTKSSTLILSSLCTIRSFLMIGLIGFFLLQIFTFVILDGLSTSTTTIGRNMMESKSKSTTIKVDDLIESENEDENNERPILMIGGSDGSGTRAIVEMLRELGTIIVSDDPQTFDVHASELSNGWPGLIQRVYSVTDGSSSGTIFSSSSSTSSSNNSISNRNNTSVLLNNNYDWPPLPPTQMEEDEKRRMKKNIANVEAEIRTLKQSWDTKYDTIAKPNHQQEYYNRRTIIYKKDQKKKQKNISPIAAATLLSNGNGGRHTTFPALAQNIKYAIKAPVSMLVLPVIVSSFRRKQKQELAKRKEQKQIKKQPILKFLHVIRDGRDVAVSENQSPVLKFYNLTYPTSNNKNNNNNNNNTARMRLLQFTNEIIKQELNANATTTTTGEEDQQQQKLDNINNIVIYAKAIQLWNDWNSMVYRWATTTTTINPIPTTNAVPQNNNNNNDVDYLVIKIEDLLIAGSPERYTAIVQMSKYVNSTLSIEELCCLCRKDTQDYGKSSKITSTFNHGNVNNNHRNKNRNKNKSENDDEDDDNNIIARWEMQQRDKQKREQQQQHISNNIDQQQEQEHQRRRLMLRTTKEEDPPSIISEEDFTTQQQEHQRRRRLMLITKEKDPSIISEEDFTVDYHSWKIVTDKILKKKKKKNTDDTKMYVVDGLIRHGEELYAQRQQQQQQQQQSTIGIKNVEQQQQQVDDDNDSQEGIHRSIIDQLKMKLLQIRMEIHNRMANNTNNSNSNSNLNQRPSDPTIKKRYGKWQSILKKNTVLSNFFHHEGAEGLKLFGYYNNDAAAAVVPSLSSSSSSSSSSSVVEDTNPDDTNTGGGINICEVSIACPE